MKVAAKSSMEAWFRSSKPLATIYFKEKSEPIQIQLIMHEAHQFNFTCDLFFG
jgi:hypothetical protein